MSSNAREDFGEGSWRGAESLPEKPFAALTIFRPSLKGRVGLLISPYTEEIAEQRGSTRCVAGAHDRWAVMTGRLLEKPRAVQDCATLGIVGGEHKTVHARKADRSGAHRARLKRNEERRSD